ncbi:MAG: hypothetical protein ACK5B9_00485 [Flavobacteriia bacterium]|jgi:hypothetical protein
MKKLTLIAAIFAVNSFFSQENFNLPPGSVVKEKAHFKKDLSSKIYDTPNFSQVEQVKSELLKDLNESNLLEMKQNNIESFEYYSKALSYFTNLDQKVLALFTAEQLWYIYQFDRELTETLKNLK